MGSNEAFTAFINCALSPAKAKRYSTLAVNAKGQRELLKCLDHDLERAIRLNARRGIVDRETRCYAYHTSVGFGGEFPSVADAYGRLSTTDGWLIVVSDGSDGIYRPEARWDAEVEIVG
jgi:hypothetical protein